MVCAGHPLHSTALEEDLQPPQAEGPQTSRQRGAAAKRKQEAEEEEKENSGKRRKRSLKAKDKLR